MTAGTSVLRRDLKVVRDGDVRVPCYMLFQADMAEVANARLPRVAWLTHGMSRSVVDDDRSRCCRLALETGNSSETVSVYARIVCVLGMHAYQSGNPWIV